MRKKKCSKREARIKREKQQIRELAHKFDINPFVTGTILVDAERIPDVIIREVRRRSKFWKKECGLD